MAFGVPNSALSALLRSPTGPGLPGRTSSLPAPRPTGTAIGGVLPGAYQPPVSLGGGTVNSTPGTGGGNTLIDPKAQQNAVTQRGAQQQQQASQVSQAANARNAELERQRMAGVQQQAQVQQQQSALQALEQQRINLAADAAQRQQQAQVNAAGAGGGSVGAGGGGSRSYSAAESGTLNPFEEEKRMFDLETLTGRQNYDRNLADTREDRATENTYDISADERATLAGRDTLNQQANLQTAAERRRNEDLMKNLPAFMALMGDETTDSSSTSGAGGAGGSGLGADAERANFTRSKELAALNTQAALKSLSGIMRDRGFSSGDEISLDKTGDILAGGARDLTGMNADQLNMGVKRAYDVEDRNAASKLTKRGQNLGALSSLMGLFNNTGRAFSWFLVIGGLLAFV